MVNEQTNKNLRDNNELVAKTKKQLMQFLIIEKRSYILDAIERYYIQDSQGTQPIVLPTLKGRMISYYMDLKQVLDDNLKEDVKDIEKNISGDKIEDIEKAFFAIDNFLHKIGLTSLADKRGYDAGNPFEEDSAKGM